MSKNNVNRMKRVFAMQRRKEEQQRVAVADARRRVASDTEALAEVDEQLDRLAQQSGDAASLQFGRLLVESGLRASAFRRNELEASLANLDTEYLRWQAERQRAASLEKVVDRFVEEHKAAIAKAEEAQLEELALARRASGRH